MACSCCRSSTAYTLCGRRAATGQLDAKAERQRRLREVVEQQRAMGLDKEVLFLQLCCLLHERFKSVKWLPVRRITWDSMRLSSALAVIAGGHHFHVWRGGEQWWWQLHFTRA